MPTGYTPWQTYQPLPTREQIDELIATLGYQAIPQLDRMIQQGWNQQPGWQSNELRQYVLNKQAQLQFQQFLDKQADPQAFLRERLAGGKLQPYAIPKYEEELARRTTEGAPPAEPTPAEPTPESAAMSAWGGPLTPVGQMGQPLTKPPMQTPPTVSMQEMGTWNKPAKKRKEATQGLEAWTSKINPYSWLR